MNDFEVPHVCVKLQIVCHRIGEVTEIMCTKF